MTSQPELISLQVSPFSLASRWALRHCDIPFQVTPYAPIVGEFGLRLRLLWRGYWRSKVTVPILLVGNTVYPSTLDIAVYAHATNPSKHLIDDLEQVRAWDARFQLMLAYFRHVLMSSVSQHPELMMEYAPPPLQKFPSIARPVASAGVKLFVWKYSSESSKTSREQVREILQLMQDTLKSQKFLLGDHFTYADLLMAVAIDHLAPGPYSTIQGLRKDIILGQQLAEGFDDVVAWKTSIYDQFYQAEADRL